MSKFVIVKQVPATLGKNEVVIKPPDFLEQIRANGHKALKKKVTAINHMREILNAVNQKYEANMNIFKFPLVQYEGVPYNNESELSTIVVNLLKTVHPAVFEKVLEHDIKNRPYGTKLVYFVGDLSETGPFFRSGLDRLDEKDVEDYLSGKPKKLVGRPALTKEEVAALQDAKAAKEKTPEV